MYSIGQKVWHRGDEATVTSLPYKLHGADWQDATLTDTGRIVTLPTPEQMEQNAQNAKHGWQAQQAGFAKLRKRT